VSWLPLGSTGRVAATVKANAAPAECDAECVAEGTAECTVLGAGGSADDDAPDGDVTAEQPDSTATTHRDAAAMTGSFARLRRGRPMG
jgi:hypothetical protein